MTTGWSRDGTSTAQDSVLARLCSEGSSAVLHFSSGNPTNPALFPATESSPTTLGRKQLDKRRLNWISETHFVLQLWNRVYERPGSAGKALGCLRKAGCRGGWGPAGEPGDPLPFLPLPVTCHMTLKKPLQFMHFSFPSCPFFCFDYKVFQVIASFCLYKICICITAHTRRPWSQLGLLDTRVIKKNISEFNVQCPL